MNTVFRSKVDLKLKAIALLLPCAVFVAIASNLWQPGMLWLPVSLAALAAVLVEWVVFSTYYEFHDAALVAHAGPFHWRVPLTEIAAVSESNSVRSGPALSMDRLEVTYRDGRRLLISPADKPGFLAELHRRVALPK